LFQNKRGPCLQTGPKEILMRLSEKPNAIEEERKRIMRIHSKTIYAALYLLSFATSAQAETISLICEHRSGFYQGAVWTFTVDLDRSTITNGSGQKYSATITETAITWRVTPSFSERINLISGVMEQWPSPDNIPAWVSSYGNPGAICRKAPGN